MLFALVTYPKVRSQAQHMEVETHGSLGANKTFIGLDRCAAAEEAAPITI